MPRVFISYSRADLPFVSRLTQDLRACGVDFWLDMEKISAGEDWTDAVWDGLKACDLMLLVISPASMDSREVASEWKYYLNNQKPILPLLAAPTAHVHYQVSALQYVDFFAAPYETALAQLMDELNARLGTAFSVGTADEAPRPTTGLLAERKEAAPPAVADMGKHTMRVDLESVRQLEERLHFFDERTLLELRTYGEESWTVQVKLPPGRELVIGRGEDDGAGADLIPTRAAASGVSRRHAALRVEDNTLFIRDLNSTNFTFVEGQRLRPNEQRALKSGDRVQLGSLLLMVYFQNV
jgi:DNA-binding LytR/AlgR family response regulator